MIFRDSSACSFSAEEFVAAFSAAAITGMGLDHKCVCCLTLGSFSSGHAFSSSRNKLAPGRRMPARKLGAKRFLRD